MKAYLERARDHDEFMKTQKHEFEIGKRHLANMMGEAPEAFENQETIDVRSCLIKFIQRSSRYILFQEAIRYLFPSALYDKRAKPMMKPPEEVFPQRKAAEFDETGRPHHSFFYTSKPNFFKFLHDIVGHTMECCKFEDRMIRQQKTPDPALQLNLSGSQWISKDQLELRLVETIQDIEYNNFVNAMDRLANQPYSYRVKEFIETYRRPLLNQKITLEIPKPQVDQDGRGFITVYGEFCASFRHQSIII